MGRVDHEKVIEAILNNEDNKTNAELCTELGISDVTFYKIRNANADEIRRRVKKSIRATIPDQIRNLKRNAARGDTAAAKYLIELDSQFELENMMERLLTEIEEMKQAKLPENVEDLPFKEIDAPEDTK